MTDLDAVSKLRKILEIPDSDEIVSDASILELLATVLDELTKDVPLIVTDERVGNNEINLPLPSRWSDKHSIIREIYIVGQGSTRTTIDRNDWQIVRPDETDRNVSNILLAATSVTFTTAADAIRFKNDDIIEVGSSSVTETNWASADGASGVLALKNATAAAYASAHVAKMKHIHLSSYIPGSTDVFCIEYNAPYRLDETNDDVTDKAYTPFMYLFAHHTCLTIAASFSKNANVTIPADLAAFSPNADQWRTQAGEYLEKYRKVAGLPSEENPAVAAAVMGRINLESITGYPQVWQN